MIETVPGAGQGHGLGLSIVAAITAAHRGSCVAVARPGGGLDVTVTLPAAPRGRGGPRVLESDSRVI